MTCMLSPPIVIRHIGLESNGNDLSRYGSFLEETLVAWVNREAVNTLTRDGEGWSCKRCRNA